MTFQVRHKYDFIKGQVGTDFFHVFRETSEVSFHIVVHEKTLESPLNCKEFKLVNPKGNQP